MTVSRLSAFLLALLTTVVSAQQRPAVAAHPAPVAKSSGFSTERLARTDALLQRYVDENRIAGAVGLVLRDGRAIYERAVGWSDKEASRRMARDPNFPIASQTKALTSVAILQLVEDRRVALGNPVSQFIPTFDRTTVAVK